MAVGRCARLTIWVPFVISYFEDKRYWSWDIWGIRASGHRVEPLGANSSNIFFEVPFLAAPLSNESRRFLNMPPEASFPYLRYNPLQIFYRSKTPAALYARQKWLHQDNTKTWKNDFHETVDVLFAGQCTKGSWNNSLVPTIRALFGLHLTVRQKDPKIERGLEWLLSEEVFSERYSRLANGPHRVSVRELQTGRKLKRWEVRKLGKPEE